MEIKVNIPEYSNETGLVSSWDYGFNIEASVENNAINIKANKEGLISLAKQLLTLAQENVPAGYHWHFDEYNSLESGSCELIIEKAQ